MTRNDNGTFTWTHTTNLYREWSNLKAVFIALGITVGICFVLVNLLCIGSMSKDFFLFQCKLWGYILGGGILLSIIAYAIWAWANGGVHEREYTVDGKGIKERRIVHCPGRMKFLRGFTWIMLLMPGRPNQKMAMRGLLHDTSEKGIKVDFAKVKTLVGDRAAGTITLQTKSGQKEIFVPREDYAEILDRITKHLPKAKGQRSEKRKM